MSRTTLITPNSLCYFRIAVIPVMMLLFYCDGAVAAWANVVLVSLAGASDFFDGRLARATGQTTLTGKFLDLAADKLFVSAALVMLVGIDRIAGPWIILAVVIILRELLISGMREFMAAYDVLVPVSKLGKWKLTVQMIALGFLTAGPYGEALVPHAVALGRIVFLAAAAITVASGWDYLREGILTMRRLDAGKNPQAGS